MSETTHLRLELLHVGLLASDEERDGVSASRRTAMRQRTRSMRVERKRERERESNAPVPDAPLGVTSLDAGRARHRPVAAQLLLPARRAGRRYPLARRLRRRRLFPRRRGRRRRRRRDLGRVRKVDRRAFGPAVRGADDAGRDVVRARRDEGDVVGHVVRGRRASEHGLGRAVGARRRPSDGRRVGRVVVAVLLLLRVVLLLVREPMDVLGRLVVERRGRHGARPLTLARRDVERVDGRPGVRRALLLGLGRRDAVSGARVGRVARARRVLVRRRRGEPDLGGRLLVLGEGRRRRRRVVVRRVRVDVGALQAPARRRGRIRVRRVRVLAGHGRGTAVGSRGRERRRRS